MLNKFGVRFMKAPPLQLAQLYYFPRPLAPVGTHHQVHVEFASSSFSSSAHPWTAMLASNVRSPPETLAVGHLSDLHWSWVCSWCSSHGSHIWRQKQITVWWCCCFYLLDQCLTRLETFMTGWIPMQFPSHNPTLLMVNSNNMFLCEETAVTTRLTHLRVVIVSS